MTVPDRMHRPEGDERPLKGDRLAVLALTWAEMARQNKPDMSEAQARVAFQSWWLDNRPLSGEDLLVRRARELAEDAWMSVFTKL
ncbi:MAG: hypothetical protein ACYDGR_12740 [Candidatus Dormibacteria bacterium]